MAAAPEPRSTDRLTTSQVEAVLALAAAAEAEDGVRPVNEATELRLRSATTPPTGCEPGEPADVVHVLVDADGDLHGYAQVSGVRGDQPEVELVVHPEHRRRGTGRAMLRAAVGLVAGRRLRGWAHGDLPAAQAFASSEGFEAVRGLMRMRLDLTAELPEVRVPDGVRIRSFAPGVDDEAWLAVNARAFASHPEQGRWTATDLAARMAEPWFDADGFLVADDVATGELVGFHWTKVEGDVGEVYVVGVDPAAQGRRLGSVLTLAGLQHLRSRGLRVVDLYVESDNEPALSVYRRLGFEQAALDVMYAQRS